MQIRFLWDDQLIVLISWPFPPLSLYNTFQPLPCQVNLVFMPPSSKLERSTDQHLSITTHPQPFPHREVPNKLVKKTTTPISSSSSSSIIILLSFFLILYSTKNLGFFFNNSPRNQFEYYSTYSCKFLHFQGNQKD